MTSIVNTMIALYLLWAGRKIIIASSLCELQTCGFFSWQAMYVLHPPKEIYHPRWKMFETAAYLRNQPYRIFTVQFCPCAEDYARIWEAQEAAECDR